MSGFHRAAVGDWFRDAAVAMVTEAEPEVREDEEPEPTGRVDVYESAAIADFALCYRESLIPCGNCDCPGCYDCTPDRTEACGCASDGGIDLSEAA